MHTPESRDSTRCAALYVGDLSPDVTEEDLISKFSSTVPVVSVHLCRNSVTGKSMCYAYINFNSALSAWNAIACLNHTDLKGKSMRIMWSMPMSDLLYRRHSGFGNLFVKNLSSSINSLCLERIFSPFGVILSCKVVEENGNSKGFGFVQFHTEQSAVSACHNLNGSMVYGKKMFVAKFINKNERADMSGNQEFTNLYVKNLTEDITEGILHSWFSQYGIVFSVAIMRDGLGRSKGFGFVDFCYPVNAKIAVESLNGRPIGSKKLFVGRAMRKSERTEMLKQQFSDKFIAKYNIGSTNLFVKNLSESINETRLEEIFGSYGKILSSKVMRHENGKTRGFGFVCFSSIEESSQAIRKLNGLSVDGESLIVRVAGCKEPDNLGYIQSLPPEVTEVDGESLIVRLAGCKEPHNLGYFQSLPHEVTDTCIARVPRKDYAAIKLVSHSMGRVIASSDLYSARSNMGLTEPVLYALIRMSPQSLPRFFVRFRNGSSLRLVESIPPMPTGSAIVSVGSCIYLFGGCVGADSISHAAAYIDCKTHILYQIRNMRRSRYGAAAGFINGKIAVIGGCESGIENWIEILDLKTHTWSKLDWRNDDQSGLIEFDTHTVKNNKIFALNRRFCCIYDPSTPPYCFVKKLTVACHFVKEASCLFDTTIYSIDQFHLIFYDGKEWRRVFGDYTLPHQIHYTKAKMVGFSGRIVIMGSNASRWGFENPENHQLICVEMELERDKSGEILGRIVSTTVVLTTEELPSVEVLRTLLL